MELPKTVPDKLISFTAEREEFVDHPYDDKNRRKLTWDGSEWQPTPEGKPTIGYGFVIEPETESDNLSMTQEDAFAKLGALLQQFWDALLEALDGDNITVNVNQAMALCDFSYNIGLHFLVAHTQIWQALIAGNYDAAADYFTHYEASGGVHMAGLEVRRNAEVELFKEQV